MIKYQAGQRWTYRTDERVSGSTLLIGKVEKRLVRQPIIHVAVSDVRTDHAAEARDIGHMPFSLSAMNDSVLALVETNVVIGPQFDEGYNTWAANKGGVFDIPVADAILAVLSVSKRNDDDAFDALVTRMRAEKSEAMISALYRLLFSVDRWYFLCDPENDRTPVEWIFPEGHNGTPALLAFTSRERAAKAAVELGIYPNGSAVSVMPAAVKDAVAWIGGPDCASAWICFNLTYQNFPLYADDAVRLLQEC